MSAFEAGAWAPDRNEVWFTTSIGVETSGIVQVLNLANYTVSTPTLRSPQTSLLPLANPNGGYYFNGTLYLALAGSPTTGGSIVTIDPITLQTEEIVNSYFGLRFPSLDDVVVVPPISPRHPTSCSRNGLVQIFFSAVDFAVYGLAYALPQIPNSYWRFTIQSQNLRAAIPRADVLQPNGAALDRSFSSLYVTDFAPTIDFGVSNSSTGSPAIYKYSLDDNCLPYKKELFALVRGGSADGIKVDDYDRVWTIESEGLVVRDPYGKVIGIFNRSFFLSGEPEDVNMGNFALAGDKVVLLALTKIWIVKLTEVVFSEGRLQF
jgi:gluconolactonase